MDGEGRRPLKKKREQRQGNVHLAILLYLVLSTAYNRDMMPNKYKMTLFVFLQANRKKKKNTLCYQVRLFQQNETWLANYTRES